MKTTTLLGIVSIATLTCLSTFVGAAEEQSPAMKLVKLMAFSETAKAGAASSFAPILQQMKAKGLPDEAIKEVSEAAKRFFAKTFDDPGIEAEIAKVYENSYTPEEMAELLKFYESPIGKKSLQVMPKIMQESSKVGQKFATQNQAEFQAEMQAIMAKYAPAPAGAE